MAPTIPDGTPIRIRCGEPIPCDVGDIIATQDGGRLVVHRVVYRGRGRTASRYLLTRGDGLWLPDPPVDVDGVLGRVTAVNRGGTWEPPAQLRLTSPLTRVSLRVVATALEANVGLSGVLVRLGAAARRVVLRLRESLGRLRAR